MPISLPILPVFAAARTRSAHFLCLILLASLLSGCSHIHTGGETVYVVAQQTYLHDRVAAVSNRVGQVSNGDRLQVLEHGRRFLKVKTDKNQIGWLEEHAVISQATYDQFTQIAQQHKNDNVVATGLIRDDVYLHLRPGRDTERYYLLPANAKVELLVRASVPKAVPGMAPVVHKPAAPAPAMPGANTGAKATAPAPVPVPPPAFTQPGAPPPVMEDWWLIRDAQGRAGWLLAGRVDVDVPDEIAQYAEGQRIVGAYLLDKVTDENTDQNGQPVTTQKAEYVTVLSPPKSGLPFDFDQVRVFTWSAKRHRYETAYRLHPITGFLPVKVTRAPVTSGPGAGSTVPQFSFLLGNSDNVKLDPDTGVTSPVSPRTLNFQLIETTVKRVGPDMDPLPLTHTANENKTDKQGAKAGKKRR